jgi:catecholate siderophore receptor
MRDDGQVFRDLYNAQRLEFLKGPNAMIFGRGGGGDSRKPMAFQSAN